MGSSVNVGWHADQLFLARPCSLEPGVSLSPGRFSETHTRLTNTKGEWQHTTHPLLDG